MAVKLRVRTLFKGVLKHWEIDGEKECLVCWFFRDQGTCLLLTEVAKRQEGYVYVLECEYSSFSDGLSSQNHATCSAG